MNRMETMRETVARALWRNNRLDWRPNTYPYERLIEPTQADLLRLADAVLAALGLDDLDAAVERAAQGVWDEEQASEAAAQQAEYGNDAGGTVEPLPWHMASPGAADWYRDTIRTALKYALTATDGAENG